MPANQTVMDAVADYDYPVAFGFEAGHQQPNKPLIIGRTAQLSVDKQISKLDFGNERA